MIDREAPWHQDLSFSEMKLNLQIRFTQVNMRMNSWKKSFFDSQAEQRFLCDSFWHSHFFPTFFWIFVSSLHSSTVPSHRRVISLSDGRAMRPGLSLLTVRSVILWRFFAVSTPYTLVDGKKTENAFRPEAARLNHWHSMDMWWGSEKMPKPLLRVIKACW